MMLPHHVATAVAIAVAVGTTEGIDNGMGLTPPRGWRSWNLFHADVNDTVMRNQMHAVLDTSRLINGRPGNLADLGFSWISMDDGWQKCNCSAPGSEDPALPKCGNCKVDGNCSWHAPDADGGRPVVDIRKFPDIKGLVSYGHSLGLNVGGYMNNCICMEGGDPPMGAHCKGETHYSQDVDFIVDMGFDGVKIDNCGASHNVTRWAELFNASGRPIRIESCHTFHPNHGTPSGWPNFPVWDPATKAANAECPMNLYRTGGDIGASFSSVIGESYAVIQYNDRPDPFSHPGCWAYPDMSEIGNFHGPDPLRTDEERTHWGLWVVQSAPLILGLDMANSSNMDRIWPIIANTEALAINDAWAGHPGTLVKSYPGTGPGVPLTVDQAPCDGRPESLGWAIVNSQLRAPPAAAVAVIASAQCLGTASGPAGQTTQQESSCPPPTTHMPESGCGSVFSNCADAKGTWSFNTSTGQLQHSAGAADPDMAARKTAPPPQKCLVAQPQARVGGFYGGPKAANTAIGDCPGGKRLQNTSTFEFTANGEIKVRTGVCLIARPLYGAQLWAKPLPGHKVAVLVVNILDQPQDLQLPLADIPSLVCDGPGPDRGGSGVGAVAGCPVRSVWDRKDLAPATTYIGVSLRSHESAFYVLG